MKLRNLLPISRYVTGAHFEWQTTVKRGRALGAALLRVLHFREGGLTFRWYSATFQFAKFVVGLQRSSGWTYVVIYLKACSVLLQQSASGHKIDNTRELKCAVSRTDAGLPRIIPMDMRKKIRSHDLWTVRLWLTFFQLYRVIEIPGKLKLSTIVGPSTMECTFLRSWFEFLIQFMPTLFELISDKGAWKVSSELSRSCRNTVPLPALGESLREFTTRVTAQLWRMEPNLYNLKPRLIILSKSGPNTQKPYELGPGPYQKSSLGTIFTDYYCWKELGMLPLLQDWLHLVQGQVFQRYLVLFDKVLEFIFRGSADYFELGESCPLIRKAPEDQYPSGTLPGFGGSHGSLGKLAYKPEPAGKIRVFALVDSLTQMIMKPVHDLLFSILRRIPTDGTFDQIRPVIKLIERGKQEFWSYDLASATDRFPVVLQQAVMSWLLGHNLAKLWVSILIDRDFRVPQTLPGFKGGKSTKVPKGTPLKVRYGAGQPMGALTSWAAFSLTHHLLVQFAAYKAGWRDGWFMDYGLLGDDIVLAHAGVAREYLALLQAIGVEVGLAKSLISSTGGLEFAKRTFSRGKEVSGLSLLALGVAKGDPTILEQLHLFAGKRSLWETIRISARVLGYGYRTVGRLSTVLQKKSRLQGLGLLLSRPGGPWSSSIKGWLLQVIPGRLCEIPDTTVLEKFAQELEKDLGNSVVKSLNAHLGGITLNRDGFERFFVDLKTKTFHRDAATLLGGDIYREVWNHTILGELYAGMEKQLQDIIKKVRDRIPLDYSQIDDLWRDIESIREELSGIPVTPNLGARPRLDFGGPRRSALIRLWRRMHVKLSFIKDRMKVRTKI